MTTSIGFSILISDNHGRVLIAQRSTSKNTFPLLWETIGGALENNETPEECIRREVQEEINCNIYDLKLFKVYIVNQEDRYVLIVYTGKINEAIKCNLELKQIRWVNRDEVSTFDFYGNELEKLLDYYNDTRKIE